MFFGKIRNPSMKIPGSSGVTSMEYVAFPFSKETGTNSCVKQTSIFSSFFIMATQNRSRCQQYRII